MGDTQKNVHQTKSHFVHPIIVYDNLGHNGERYWSGFAKIDLKPLKQMLITFSKRLQYYHFVQWNPN